MARCFAGAGFDIAVTAINLQRADAVMTELAESGASGFSQKLDITSDADWEAFHGRVMQEWGGLDVLVNNAGVAALSEPLRAELADSGVGVSVVCPSFVRTNLLAHFISPSPALRDLVQSWMDKSEVTADDVAAATLQGMKQGRFLALTHAATRKAWWLKRWWPERYYCVVCRKTGLTRRKAA